MIFQNYRRIAAGLAGLALAFNNPAGHYALNELGVRIAFAKAHNHAQQVTGLRTLSFDEFKKDAGFYLMLYYNNDIGRVASAMELLNQGARIVCLPLKKEDGGQDRDHTIYACHAAALRNRRKAGERYGI